MRALCLLILFLTQLYAQQNVCYSNCKRNSCAPDSALNCTDCDLGLININGMCVGNSNQPAPLTYLKPSGSNVLSEASIVPINCTVSSVQGNPSKTMMFSTTIGSTFTRSFSIPYQHIYIQIKFNAIIMAANTAPVNPTLLFDVYSGSASLYSSVVSLNQSSSNAVTCNNSQFAQDVFYLNQKFNSSDSSIIMQVKVSGVTNSNVALTDIEIYYGNCSSQCELCFGPTFQECITCKGLLTTLTLNNTCINCQSGFYLNNTCLACPVECDTCSFSNNLLQCTACRTAIANATNSSANSLGCVISSFKQSTETSLVFSDSGWKSSETVGSSVSQCGSYSLVGGISIGVSGSALSKTYTNLPVHTTLYLSFTLFLIDQALADTNSYELSIDNNAQYPSITIAAASGTDLTNECGQVKPEYVMRQFFNISHNATTAKITISIIKDYLAIRDVTVIVNNETDVTNCYSQLNGNCTSCTNGFTLLNSSCSSCEDGYYKKNSTCEVCPIFCKTCTLGNAGVVACLSCQSPLVLDGTFCVDSSQAMFSAQFMPNIPTTTQSTWDLYPDLINSGLDTCNNATILGSSQLKFKFLTMKRTYTGLPSHQGIALFFNFYQIDDYVQDNATVYFIFNSQRIPYKPSNLKTNLCGNSSADAVVPMYLQDSSHTGSSLTFQVHFEAMGKIGINNVILYLLGRGGAGAPFTIESVPTYSVSTPPIDGMTVKLIFPSAVTNTTKLENIFVFGISSSSRLLAEGQSSSSVPILNASINNDNQILYLLSLQGDYTNSQIQATALDPTYLYFTDADSNEVLVSQSSVSSNIPRYVDISLQDLNDRTSLSNIFNLFRGCAIFGMFIGLLSFFVGMSVVFDDFFLLCQLIFVHVFIQLDYNPPSIRIPFAGLHIVQFLEWFPWQGRQSIETSLIPSNLNQYSPIVFEQYYKDIVFVRAIYQAVLYLAVMLIFWAVIRILLLAWNSKHSSTKYTNYLLYYYHHYDARQSAFMDRVVRFAYFTVCWACVLQCNRIYNQPSAFNIWNSVLTFVFVAAVLAYPIVFFIFMSKVKDTISQSTFTHIYSDLRVSSGRLFYILVKYYKLAAIACFIGFLYAQNSVIALVFLIALNLADAIILIHFNPLAMYQPELLQAQLFYPNYPKVYLITCIAQQFLFIAMEILWLALYGQRNSASSSAYMGIGYVICAIVILLLLNGLLRLFWGFMKIVQQIHLEREAFHHSVQRQIEENRDPAETDPILQQIYKSQATLSKKDIMSRLQSKKPSYVSKLRV